MTDASDQIETLRTALAAAEARAAAAEAEVVAAARERAVLASAEATIAPMLPQPNPSTETRSPVRPRARYSIAAAV